MDVRAAKGAVRVHEFADQALRLIRRQGRLREADGVVLGIILELGRGIEGVFWNIRLAGRYNPTVKRGFGGFSPALSEFVAQYFGILQTTFRPTNALILA